MQLIAQPARGWAWTRAVLGIAAREIHVCGDHSCISILQSLCDVTGTSFTVRKYERLTKLCVDRSGLKDGDYANVQPGDCVVAFSRSDLYQIKAQIEERSPFRTAMIYGALPPLARRTQARLFNDPESEYQVRKSCRRL
jgi:ATP-dependent RNA helicase SUPV3L1/SUV3